MYLPKKILMLALCVLLVALLMSCGGDGGSSAPATPSQTVEWQLDGKGFVQFLTNDPKWYGYGLWDTYAQEYESQMTTLTATVVKQTGSPTSGYGIVFCYQDTNNFYRLLIDAAGDYSVYAKVGGTYTAIIPWTQTHTAQLNNGFGVANEITVTQQSLHNFSISFNGAQETTFSDVNFTGGRAGFCIGISQTSENFPTIPEDVRFKLTSPVEYPYGGTPPPPVSGTVPLAYQPLLTKFSKSLGKAVIVSANPNALHLVDVKAATDISVALPTTVKSINLSPDGTLAAVLHEGAVSLVDLNHGTLLLSSPTYGSQTDTFVTNSGLIYLTGQTGGQWVTPGFTALNGRTGAVVQTITTNGVVFGTTKGIYSDISNKIFSISEGLSPAQIYATSVDPATGALGGSTGSPYWGDYPMSDPFWLSADQSLLFTAAGTYFTTANLTYAGTFGVAVLSMSHSSTAQEAVVLPNNGGLTYPSVYKLFTGSLLFPASDVALPIIGGQQAYGISIFHAADDSHVLVVQTGSSRPGATGVQFYAISL